MILLGSLLAIAAAAGGLISWHKTMYHFEAVDPGRLYRSGTLSTLGLEIAHRVYGVKTIINLRSTDEMKEDWYRREQEFVRANQMHLVDIPMLVDTPPTREQVEKFLRIVTDSSQLPALVHCEMGVVRTGMMVAVYQIGVLRKSNQKALEELTMFGRTFKRRPAVKEFILSYTP